MNASLLDAGILGVVEGLTEFIPVSSTGHLILADALLRVPATSGKVFDVFIQIGAIFAVLWARRERVSRLIWGFFTEEGERRMGIKIIVAFLPAAIAGVLAHDFIKSVLFSPWVVALALLAGGIVLVIIDRFVPKARYGDIDALPLKTAAGIGLFQVLSLIPGISRAGASIVGAQILGASRSASTEFSFFLAIPTILGAAAFDLYKSRGLLTAADFPVFAVGTATAFLSAFFVVNRLIAFVSRHGLARFGWYRIALGLVVFGFLYFNWL